MVRIKVINGNPTHDNLEGQIRKRNIRKYEIDKIKIEECFLPGDIVRAKIVVFGVCGDFVDVFGRFEEAVSLNS